LGTDSSGSTRVLYEAVKAYYDRRAPEYDEWYRGLGRFDGLDRPNWDDEVRELEVVVSSLEPARTLDVACGTGFLTRHLRGDVVGLDQSAAMLEVARARVPRAGFVQGDAFELPFDDAAFDRVFTGHFYGHLEPEDRERFLAEARRVAGRLVVADAALRPDRRDEEWQERVLNDGSRWQVYKRYFTPDGLLGELGGGRVLHAGRWFVVVEA
jgi:ubiquinone/menaquinone biosynthesis C-methylase UbiE